MRKLLIIFLLFFTYAKAQDIQQVTSSNGITAWLVYDETVPTVSISFTFKGQGAATDLPNKRGSTSMMAALLTQGAGEFNSQSFQKQLNNLSVSLGFSAGKDHLHGEFTSLKKYLIPATEFLQLSLTSAHFGKSDFSRIKKIMLSGALQDEQDASASVNNLLWEFALGDDDYALPADGTPTAIKNIKLKDVKRQYANLSKQDLYIGVAGNISAEELSPLLDDIFGGLPASHPASTEKLQAQLSNQGKIKVKQQSVPQSHIAFMQTGLPRDDDDFFTAYILNHIIGGSVFSSLLGEEVRKKRGLAYSIYSRHYDLERLPIIIGFAATNNDDAAETTRLIRKIWSDSANGNFTQEQLDSARLYLLGSYVIGLTNTSALSDWLAYLQRIGESPDYINYREKRFSAITLEDLQRVARRLLNADSLTFAIVGSPKGIE